MQLKLFFLHIRPQLNQYVQDVHVPATPKSYSKSIDRLPYVIEKPNFFQKTPCFGKIPTEKVFLVVLPKLNFR